MAENDDFLSRWSKRKREIEAEDAQPEPKKAVTSEPDAETYAEPETEQQEAALLEQLGLPKPETLVEGDDFSAFMQANVPDFLRRRALRVLWRSNPVLANLDGLNDYDDDFNSPELTQKVIATGYQVGRGFVRELLAEEDEKPTHEPRESPPMEPVEPGEGEGEGEESQDDSPMATVASIPAVPEEQSQLHPRRMRFET